MFESDLKFFEGNWNAVGMLDTKLRNTAVSSQQISMSQTKKIYISIHKVYALWESDKQTSAEHPQGEQISAEWTAIPGGV